MPSIRIIPAYRPRGLYAAAIALAILAAAAQTALMQINAVSRLRADLYSEFLTTLGPLLLFALAIAPFCQRFRPVLLASLLFGFTHQLALIATGTLAESSDYGAKLLSSMWVAFFFVSTITALITALFAILIRWLVRTFIVTLVEQTGSLCTNCAYTLDPPTLPLCPECGQAPDLDRIRYRRLFSALAAIQRSARPAAIALVLLLFVTAAIVILTRGLPLVRFRNAVGGGGFEQFASAGFIETTGPDGATHTKVVAGAWKSSPDDPAAGLIVAYDVAAKPADPSMQIWAATKTTVAAGPGAFSITSEPVLASLTRAQTQHVLHHGVPDSLAQALQDAVKSRNQRPYEPRTFVDPTPHFPH